MKFPKFALVPILPVSLILMAGCDSNDGYQKDFETPEVAEGAVRYTNVIADGTPLRFAVGSNYRDGSLDYAATSGLVPYYGGNINVNFAAPVGEPGEEVALAAINSEPLALTIQDETRIDVFAVGEAGDEELITLTAPASFSAAGTSARVVVAHLAPDAPQVDVYVTAPDAALTGALGTMSYQESLGPQVVTEGDYRIRVTPAGSSTVIFDSGAMGLAKGSDLVIGAIPNVYSAGTADASPIVLMALAGDGSSTILFDQRAPAELRVVNLSPNTSPATTGFDVVLVDSEDETTEVGTDVGFTEDTGYQAITVTPARAGETSQSFDVLANFTGTETGFLDADASVDLGKGRAYTSFLANTVQELELFTVEDQPRPAANAGKLRVIHGSAAADAVDIYLTADDDISEADPLVEDVKLGDATNYWYFTAGTYVLSITPKGDKEVVLSEEVVELAEGVVLTAFAHDNVDLESVDVTVLEDAAPAEAAAAE